MNQKYRPKILIQKKKEMETKKEFPSLTKPFWVIRVFCRVRKLFYSPQFH